MKQADLAPPAHQGHSDGRTVDRILDAAGQLFADDGFETVSLRHLTQAAGVNLAAVNCHFGSKDALIDAVIERYITPVNEERLARLASLEEHHGDDDTLRAAGGPSAASPGASATSSSSS